MALAAAGSGEVPAGHFGFCSLLDAARESFEIECFVAQVCDGTATLLLPGVNTGSTATSEAEWTRLGAKPSDVRTYEQQKEFLSKFSPELSVEGVERALKIIRVPAPAVRPVALSQGTRFRFDSPKPCSQMLMTAFYRSEFVSSEGVTVAQTSTDVEAAGARGMEIQLRKLQQENADLRRKSLGRPSPTRRSHGRPECRAICASSDEDRGTEGDSEVGPDTADLLVRRLEKFAYKGQPRPGRPSRGAAGSDLGGEFYDAEETRPGETFVQRSGSRARDRAEGAAAGPGDGARSRAWSPESRRHRRRDPCELQQRDIEREIQLEMLRTLKEIRGSAGSSGHTEAPEGNELDGLRVLKSLGRMRAIKEGIQNNPKRVYSEYKEQWVVELGAEGRPFRWLDRNRFIRWKKFKSVKRFDWILCHILELLDQGRVDVARAQTVQSMKCLHTFANHGSWSVAWPHTHLVDPLRNQVNSATEAENEAVLSYLKAEDDIRSKLTKGVHEQVSDEDEGEAEVGPPGTTGGQSEKGHKPPKKKKQA